MNLKQCVGGYFRDNFVTGMRVDKGHIFTDLFDVQIDELSQYVRSILIEQNDLHFLKPNHFQSLSSIEFQTDKLTNTESLENVLNNVETLKLLGVKLDTDFHEMFLRFCGKLKRLYVNNVDMDPIIGKSNNWLGKQYPFLEHFELISNRQVDQVIRFLEAHPKIHTFSTSDHFLMANKESMLSSNIELDVLAVLHTKVSLTKTKLDEIIKQLVQLQDRRFFKHLNLYSSWEIDINIFTKSLLPVVKILNVITGRKFAVSPFVNLEKLYARSVSQITDLNTALDQLNKLNYIFFARGKITNMLPFINRLASLRAIQMDTIEDSFIDSSALNSERSKLANASKVTIYVEEPVYLATKISFKQTKTDLIEIRRVESDNDSHDFTYTDGNIG